MKQINADKRIGLNSSYFETMRNELDIYIRRMMPVMKAKETSEGSINLKIDFDVLEKTTRCEASPSGYRKSIIPNIDYKISMTLKSKAETKGEAIGAGHEAIADGDDYYIITEAEANGQMSMFDEPDDETEDEDDHER